MDTPVGELGELDTTANEDPFCIAAIMDVRSSGEAASNLVWIPK
jgi:hypothetical protein